MGVAGLSVGGTSVSKKPKRTYRTERKRTPGNVNARNFGNGDTGEGSDRVGDVNFRFLGIIRASNLDKASESTIRLDNLAMARDMELANKDAKAIKYATGWERGVDSKWRYEIEDGKLRFSSFWYSSATYLVGGSQSSSGKTKESFSIEKKKNSLKITKA